MRRRARLRSPRRAARALGAACLSLAFTGVAAPGAFGHAAFVESSPPPGVRLEQTPARISLEFTDFMRQRFFAVNEPVAIEPPPGAVRGR